MNAQRRRIHPHGDLAPIPHEEYLKCPDGIPIYIQSFIPNNPRAMILCQHGANIHGDLYFMLADHLYPQGIGVVAVDNRGHGRSGPLRGRIDYPERIFPVYEQLISRYSDLPWHVHGESLGCIMISWFLTSRVEQAKKKHSIESVILQVPPYRIHFVSKLKFLLPIFKIIFPFLRILSLDRPFLAFKPDFRPSYFREFHRVDQLDPIRAPKISAKHFQTMMEMFSNFQGIIPLITQPILVLEGSADDLLDCRGTIELKKTAVHSHHTKICIYQGADHSLFNDMNAQGIYDDIYNWIQSYFPKL